jgi:drug/metabolite transporter (DMT)-like permease
VPRTTQSDPSSARGPSPSQLATAPRAADRRRAVLLSALGFAGAAFVYRRWLDDVPAVGVTALMTAISSLAFLAPAAVNLPRQIPPVSSILALAALGLSIPASRTGCFTC